MVSRTYSQPAALARLAARWPGIPGRLPALVALTDPERTPDISTYAADLPKGCALIYRHFGQKTRFAEAAKLSVIARDRGLTLLVAADPELADACDADGVHWPARCFRNAARWRDRNGDAVMTMAAHDRRELERAVRAGADAAILSPVFQTRSHAGASGLGVLRARALVRTAELPVYALGGITTDTAKRLAGSGFSGLAAIGGVSA
jgi:thiamine-phosphate pyrophosphorylase